MHFILNYGKYLLKNRENNLALLDKAPYLVIFWDKEIVEPFYPYFIVLYA